MNARSASPRAALRVPGIALAVVAVLLAAAWIALAVLLPHERVLALVRGQLARSLRREARLADVSVRLWPPVRLAARGFELAEPGGFARGAAAKVGSLDLDLDVLPLLSRRLVVRSLTLEQPTLHLVLRADGTTNLDSLFAAAPAAGPQAGGGRVHGPRGALVRRPRGRVAGGRPEREAARLPRPRHAALPVGRGRLALRHEGPHEPLAHRARAAHGARALRSQPVAGQARLGHRARRPLRRREEHARARAARAGLRAGPGDARRHGRGPGPAGHARPAREGRGPGPGRPARLPGRRPTRAP